jgi:hypothetical protein
VPEYFVYPLRDLLVSCTLCVASTLDLINDDKVDDMNEELVRSSRAVNDTLDIPSNGNEFKPNPIKEGEKLKFDVSEESPTEDDYEQKRRSAAPRMVFSKQDT